MQLTTSVSRKYKLEPDVRADQPMDAASIIFGGSAVGLNPATFYARQLVGGDKFLGFADAQVKNQVDPLIPNAYSQNVLIGTPGALNVGCRVNGIIILPVSAIAGATGLANVDQAVFASDGNSFELAEFTTTLTVTGSPTGGNFNLSGSGTTGSLIAYNATAAGVTTGLPANVSGNVLSVTGSAGGPWTINWGPGVIPPVLSIGNGLTGGSSPGVTVGAATAAPGLSHIGTIRSFFNLPIDGSGVYQAGMPNGLFEVKFTAETEKVS